MRKHFILIALLWLLHLSSCVPNKTCPAFQSYFILDEKAREDQFSKFDSDSIPKYDYAVKKSKYGVVKKISYRKKQDDWNSVQMDIIMPTLEDEFDSVLIAQEIYDVNDSLFSDSKQTPQSVRRRDRYNEDQLQYMRLFGKYLRKPVKSQELDVSKALDKPAGEESLGEPKKKKGLFGFLKKKSKKDKPEKKKKDKKKRKKKKEEDLKEEIDTAGDDISDTNF